MGDHRFVIVDRFLCRTERGQGVMVLEWRHEHLFSEAGEPIRWAAVGASEFTLSDACAVLPLGESAFEVVSTGEVVEFAETTQEQRPWGGWFRREAATQLANA